MLEGEGREDPCGLLDAATIAGDFGLRDAVAVTLTKPDRSTAMARRQPTTVSFGLLAASCRASHPEPARRRGRRCICYRCARSW